MNIVLAVVLYFVEVIPIYTIARKCGQEYAWLAWVPIADAWLLFDLAGLPIEYMLGLLIPGLNLVLVGFVWWQIAENTNKPGWIGLLMLIPLVNLGVGYYIAYVETGSLIA